MSRLEEALKRSGSGGLFGGAPGGGPGGTVALPEAPVSDPTDGRLGAAGLTSPRSGGDLTRDR